MTYQGKTLVVAFCSVLLLHKQLSRAKWLAITLLATGIATVQLSSSKEGKQSSMANDAEQNITTGLIYVLLGCFCSGFAGVYFEKILKDPKFKCSVWMRNVQLGLFSTILGLGGVVRPTSSF